MHSIETLWKFSRIDEQWQEDQWGVDDDAAAEADLKKQAFFHAYNFYKMAAN
ncbi:MAG: hypothetical protein GY883_23395 [Shimia sp.]|nr:hypothetical protein [Shimia sp.]